MSDPNLIILQSSRYSTLRMQGQRVIGMATCDEYFGEDCPHFNGETGEWLTEEPCPELIITGMKAPSADAVASGVLRFDETEFYDFGDVWADACAWLAGDDTKGCSCDTECRCGRWLDDASVDSCVCLPCAVHGAPLAAQT